jgi:O-antigen ligase
LVEALDLTFTMYRVDTTQGLAMPGAWTSRSAAALAIVVAFWFVGHAFDASTTMRAESAISADRVENHFAVQQRETTTSSAVGYFLLGGLGAACWLSGAARGANFRSPLMLFCAAYVGWCLFSLMWSIEPPQSVRKLAILMLMLTAGFGLSARYELEDLVWITVLTLAAFVGIGVLAELAAGTFRPWRSDYRFCGTCHPNDQGLQCALLAMAAGFADFGRRDRPWLRQGLILAGVAGLALSKSRTTLAALVAAAALALVLRSRGLQRWLVLATCITLVSLAGMAMSFVSATAIDQTADVAAMGRRENINSLTGRLPLWHELWKAADDHWLVGHGFGGFWGSDNVLKYSKIFSWHIPHGHNAYLDMVLAIGFVGMGLYLAWSVATMAVAAARQERSRRAAERFVVCLLAFSLVHGATESKFPSSGIGGFFLIVAMVALAVRAPQAAPAAATTLRSESPRWLSWRERLAAAPAAVPRSRPERFTR